MEDCPAMDDKDDLHGYKMVMFPAKFNDWTPTLDSQPVEIPELQDQILHLPKPLL